MNKEVNHVVLKIAEKVFKCSENQIDLKSSANDIEKWDSLSNIHFILALEEEFKIKFKSSEILNLKNSLSILKNKKNL